MTVVEPLTAPIGPVAGYDVHVELGYYPEGTGVSRWDSATWASPGNGVWSGAAPREDVSCNVKHVTMARGRDLPLERFRPGVATVELYDPTGKWSPWRTAPDPATYATVRPGIDLYVWINTPTGRVNRFVGIVDSIDETWPSPGNDDDHVVTFNALDYLSLLAAFNGVEQAAQGAGELGGARLTRITNNASYQYAKNFDAGTVALQATTLAQVALDESGMVTDTELGALWCDGDGVLQFRDRNGLQTDAHYTAAQATFGEVEPEICYTDLQLSTDLDKLKNDVSISNAGGTAVTRVDTTSISLYQRRTFRRFDLIHVDPAQSLVIAQRQLDFYAYAANRVDAISLELTTLSSAKIATVIALRILYRIQVRRRAQGFQVVADLQIQGIREDITPDKWTLTFETFSAAAVFRVGRWDVDTWNSGLWGY